MSAAVPSLPSVPPPISGSRSLDSLVALGVGPIRRNFGHQLAANPQGDVLVATRLDSRGAALAELPDAENTEVREDATNPQLIKLGPGGQPVWCRHLREANGLCAPNLALDDSGGAYVVGAYAPHDGELCGDSEVHLTRLSPSGTVEWSHRLLSMPADGRARVPFVRIAASPQGDAWVTWVTLRNGAPAVRAERFSKEGSPKALYVWDGTGEIWDPHVAVDARGEAALWGAFRGAVSMGARRLESKAAEARYLSRITDDGRVSWAGVIEPVHRFPHAITLSRAGDWGLTGLGPSERGPRPAELRTEMLFARLGKDGTTLKSLRGECSRHAAIPWLTIVPVGDGAFAVVGYLAGSLSLGGARVESPMAAVEAVFVASIDASGKVWARALAVPQLVGGLMARGNKEGSVLVSGWIAGSMALGRERIASPPDKAVLFLARLHCPEAGLQ